MDADDNPTQQSYCSFESGFIDYLSQIRLPYVLVQNEQKVENDEEGRHKSGQVQG